VLCLKTVGQFETKPIKSILTFLVFFLKIIIPYKIKAAATRLIIMDRIKNNYAPLRRVIYLPRIKSFR